MYRTADRRLSGIEVPAKNDAHAESAKRAILSVFENCGIDESVSENRYYNDMIDEAIRRTKTAENGETETNETP